MYIDVQSMDIKRFCAQKHRPLLSRVIELIHLIHGNGEFSPANGVHVLETWHFAPMRRCVRHEELIKSAKSTGKTRRQANQPQQLFLITTELTNDRQKIVKIETSLRDEKIAFRATIHSQLRIF